MRQQTFRKLSNLTDKWIAEANSIISRPYFSEPEGEKARTLVDCAEALNNTLKKITDAETELILSNKK